MLFEFCGCAGIDHAIRTMRHSHQSEDKSDSEFWSWGDFKLGAKDYELAMHLVTSDSSYRENLRLADVWLEIYAPLYWWKQFDTYCIGVDKSSDSTMYCLMKRPLMATEFEDCLDSHPNKDEFLKLLNDLREKGEFDKLNSLLPQSYCQRRTIKLSYEALNKIYEERKHHKLAEWRFFCKMLEHLPYSYFITGKYDPNYTPGIESGKNGCFLKKYEPKKKKND